MSEFTTRPVIQGNFGVVAAGHYLAAAVGMRVLEAGGNAVDAGVAAGFCLNLVKPQSNGIGGEAPILIHRGGAGPAPRLASGRTTGFVRGTQAGGRGRGDRSME